MAIETFIEKTRDIRANLHAMDRRLMAIESAIAAGADPQLDQLINGLAEEVQKWNGSLADAHLLADAGRPQSPEV